MPTQEQREASRRNARRSTGPRTPEGKAVAALNRTAHGLSSSRVIVLPEESKQEYQQLLDRYRAEFRPQSPFEDCCVRQMAAADWRLNRILRIEKGFLVDRLEKLRDDLDIEPPEPDPADTEADQRFDQDTRLLGSVFWRNCTSDSFMKLVRYETSTRRAFYKALHELRLARSRRSSPAGPAPPPKD